MANLQRPRTAGSMQRPSLADNGQGQYYETRTYTYEGSQPSGQQQTAAKPPRPATAFAGQAPPRVGRSLLSNDNWRQATMADVCLNARAIEQSDRNILYGKGIDALPQVRDTLAQLSNTEAFLYARQCRVVVAKLRLCSNDVNEEIKSLLKHRDYTEAAIDHIRKDLIINRDSVNMRRKPKRESELDGVDDILAAEKYHLMNIKKVLETHCKSVQTQMQRLDEVRHRLTRIGKERSQVTELICQCLTKASRTFEAARTEKLENLQGQRVSSAHVRRSQSAVRRGSDSAEAKLLDENGFPLVGHLQPFTPDVVQAFDDAAKLIDESREIKRLVTNQIKDSFNDAKAYSLTVNQSIAQKLADIITLAQNLTISLGENMLAQNRAQRWRNLTMGAQRANAGPKSAASLTTAERFDRPIIRTFQRHPANQLPEAHIALKATTNLQQSADQTQNQMNTLKVVGQRLQANLTDKEAALEIDAHLLRQRRGRSNHKWGATKYVHA